MTGQSLRILLAVAMVLLFPGREASSITVVGSAPAIFDFMMPTQVFYQFVDSGGTALTLGTDSVQVGTFSGTPMNDLSNFTQFQGLTSNTLQLGTFSTFAGQLFGSVVDNTSVDSQNAKDVEGAPIYVVIDSDGDWDLTTSESGIFRSDSTMDFINRPAGDEMMALGEQPWTFSLHTAAGTDRITISAGDINEAFGNGSIESGAGLTTFKINPIPEPAAAFLGLLAFGLLCCRRARR